MTTKSASAEWGGNLEDGTGTLHFGDKKRISEPYCFDSRFKEGMGTGPEDLIAAAHAGCFSMALAHLLDGKEFDPERVVTSAAVSLEEDDDGFAITTIRLKTSVLCPDLEEKELQMYAEDAAENCPVSKALAGADITVDAVLLNENGLLGK
jgi:osmotically inducible protein OsmC